jgi:hypothetical protein
MLAACANKNECSEHSFCTYTKQLIEFGVKFPGAETGGGISLWQKIMAFFK